MIRIILTLMVVTGIQQSIFTQEVPEEDNAKIEEEIQKEVKKRLREIVTPLVLAEKLKMEFPPKAPTEKVADLNAKVSKDVMEKVNAKYPPSTKDIHLKAALKKYVLYKEGDQVTNLRIRPAGRNAVISGKYSGKNRKGEYVVGSYPIPKVDVNEDVLAHFEPEVNKKKIETYIKNKMFYFHDDREKMKKELTPVLQNEYFTAAGYFKDGDNYLPADKFLKSYYEKEKVRVAKIIRQEVEGEIMGKYAKAEEAVDIDPLAETKPEEKTSPEDDFSITEEAPAEEEINVRKKTPLFDPGFYDPEF